MKTKEFRYAIPSFVLMIAAITFASCSDTGGPSCKKCPPACDPCSTVCFPCLPTCTYDVVNTFDHDPEAFTQGLVYLDSMLIEGTGYYFGPSTLRRVEIETGTVVQQRTMPDASFFGEGVTVWGDKIIQLTWLDSVAVVYDVNTFDEVGRFDYPTEGWGLTHDGKRLIMSDGTDTLYFRDPDTFAEIGRIEVTYEGDPVVNLNELEYICGYIFANVWQTDFIVVISPQSGKVVSRIDLTYLRTSHGIPANRVLNGIAYDADNKRLFVTGKRWPKLFEIELAAPTQ